ncbi:MAG TPA: putative Ig domain-containing protein, partial [Chthoniobacteraceae bacterium]
MKKPSPRLWLALLTLLVIAASVAILQRETTQQISAASQPGAVFHTEAVVSSVGSDAEAPSTVDAKAPSAAPAVPLFNAPGATIGTRLNPKGAAYMQARLDGKTVKGRMAPLELRSFGGLPAVQVGETVRLPLIDGEAVEGVVNFAETNSRGWTRVAGSLTGNKRGSFVLATTAKKASGLIQLPDEQLAYEIVTHPDGQLMMHERLLSEVICSPLPWPREEEGRKAARAPVPQGAPPILSSRPDAEGVLYLDFDGETVTDPAWNDGRTIVAAAARMTAAQITDVWNRVKEDFLAFNVDVTTNEERYNQAPVGKRMRCIITPTNSFYKNAGGVAYLGSFAEAGFGFYSETIPCWVFIDNNTKACAEAVSHEFGHTFDLSHDGRTSPFTEYYEGHGSGSTGWAPIMGVGYYRELVQWSRGEYTGANRTQDDIAIIAGPQNDIGFAPDEAGGAIDSAMPVETDNGDILQRGVISQASDADFYIFNTTGGTATINAVPAPTSPNVDLLIEVQDGSGTVVSRANPPDALNSALSTTLPAGTYYLKVQGIGKGDVKDGGYSSYGSVGAYTLSGSVPGLFRRPIVTNLSRVLGRIDEPFSLQITARNAPTSYGVSGSLPPGVTLDPTTGLMTGIATVAGRYDVVLIATNEFGDGSKPVTITISPGLIPLGEAADATDLPWTSTTPEWLGQAFVTHDGVDAVESPELGNSQESRLQATVVGPATVTFRWKVSSQEGADFLGFAIDGNTLTRIS